ncbi:MAG: hypothetical protein QXD60_02710 [Nanopusillaceae archaeon]
MNIMCAARTKAANIIARAINVFLSITILDFSFPNLNIPAKLLTGNVSIFFVVIFLYFK